MFDINELLKIVVDRGASDLHIQVGLPPKMRLHGRLEVVVGDIVSSDDAERLMKEIAPQSYLSKLTEVGSIDFGYDYSELARFRTAVYYTHGEHLISIAMRLIPTKILSFAELGLPIAAIADALEAPRGLVLVTGPTGSGKSTTLASMIDWINVNHDVHIITIEDPIEYRHGSKRSIVNQREVGVDLKDFAFGVRGALRMDPDVILIGEMRDLETIRAAVSAAETGHLVFATLHTQSASETVNRIIDAFPSDEQEQVRIVLSTSLRTIITQALLPRSDGRGRVAAFEILHNVPAVGNHIREQRVNQINSVIQTNAKSGMISLDDSLFGLYRRGLITGELCMAMARDRKEMEKKLLAV